MICKPFFCAGSTAAASHAASFLRRYGISVSAEPMWDTGNLLLDVPSFQGRALRGGGTPDTLLQALPRDIVIWGGNLSHPALEGFRTVDLLKDEEYLARNAAITAHCTLQLLMPMVDSTLDHCPTLIIGWGRIGKCLGKLLASIGTPVIVAARKQEDRACLASLGYAVADPVNIRQLLPELRIIINTAPAPILSKEDVTLCQDAIKLDLASVRGIAGDDVIHARGLPGIHAPESSGKLIADTIIRLSKEVTI